MDLPGLFFALNISSYTLAIQEAFAKKGKIMNLSSSEIIILFIILIAVLGLLFLDGAGVGPVHRWQGKKK